MDFVEFEDLFEGFDDLLKNLIRNERREQSQKREVSFRNPPSAQSYFQSMSINCFAILPANNVLVTVIL